MNIILLQKNLTMKRPSTKKNEAPKRRSKYCEMNPAKKNHKLKDYFVIYPNPKFNRTKEKDMKKPHFLNVCSKRKKIFDC